MIISIIDLKENDINYQLDLMKVKEKYDLELFNKIDLIKNI